MADTNHPILRELRLRCLQWILDTHNHVYAGKEFLNTINTLFTSKAQWRNQSTFFFHPVIWWVDRNHLEIMESNSFIWHVKKQPWVGKWLISCHTAQTMHLRDLPRNANQAVHSFLETCPTDMTRNTNSGSTMSRRERFYSSIKHQQPNQELLREKRKETRSLEKLPISPKSKTTKATSTFAFLSSMWIVL